MDLLPTTEASVDAKAADILGEMADRSYRDDAARNVQTEQVYHAARLIDLPTTAYVRWPWQSLAHTMGGIGPGTLGFVAAASGSGKTSFLLSGTRLWVQAGYRVYYAGLETRASTLRAQLACRELGLDPADVLGGDAAAKIPDWHSVRERLRQELRAQVTAKAMERVRLAPFRFVNLATLDRMFGEAADFGADVVVIDHVDHIDGGTGGTYDSSVRAVRRLLTLTQDRGMRVIAATQTNLSNAAQDPLRFYRPIRREQIKMGNHKVEVADWMLGLYRPLRQAVPREQIADWKDGRLDLSVLLECGVTELNVIKHRLRGDREGTRIRLGFSKGEVLNAPLTEADRSRLTAGGLI